MGDFEKRLQVALRLAKFMLRNPGDMQELAYQQELSEEFELDGLECEFAAELASRISID